MRRRALVLVALAVLASVSVFFLAPVVYLSIPAWTAARPGCSVANPCRTRFAGYESPSCAIWGVGVGIDGLTSGKPEHFSNGTTEIVETQKPWTLFWGCPPIGLPPPR